MSLDWDVKKCPGFNEGNPTKEFLDWRDLIVYGTMRVGLGALTEQNIDEWEFRVEVCKAFGEEFGSRPKEGGGFERLYPDRQVLQEFVGLRTNATNHKRKDWLAAVISAIAQSAERNIRYRKEQAAKAPSVEVVEGPAANEG